MWSEIMSVAFMVISLNSRVLKSDGSLGASERVLDGQTVFSDIIKGRVHYFLFVFFLIVNADMRGI